MDHLSRHRSAVEGASIGCGDAVNEIADGEDTVARCSEGLIDHIRAQGFTVIDSPDAPLPDDLRGRAVRVVDKGGYDPAKTSLDLPISREIIAAIERAHGGERAVLMPTLGGSVPIWAFTDILPLPTLLVPYANANNRQHSPNEHLRLDHLFQGVRTTAGLLSDLGR